MRGSTWEEDHTQEALATTGTLCAGGRGRILRTVVAGGRRYCPGCRFGFATLLPVQRIDFPLGMWLPF